jgi:hypothetical protein
MPKKPASKNISPEVKRTVEQIIAEAKRGWTIIPNSMRIDGDMVYVRVTSRRLEVTLGISLSRKKVVWSQG